MQLVQETIHQAQHKNLLRKKINTLDRRLVVRSSLPSLYMHLSGNDRNIQAYFDQKNKTLDRRLIAHSSLLSLHMQQQKRSGKTKTKHHTVLCLCTASLQAKHPRGRQYIGNLLHANRASGHMPVRHGCLLHANRASGYMPIGHVYQLNANRT